MYHLAEIVRDARRDMDERVGAAEGRHWAAAYPTSWAAYTPLPFLYAIGQQITSTMQRKAPDLVKRAAVLARDQIADTLTATQHSVHEWRVVTTRRGQILFYTVKTTVETVALPAPVEPLRAHVAVPVLHGVEGFAQFVTSEELPELYFVAKTSMARHVVLRHLVVPGLTAVEKLVRYMVILPTQVVFPSREEIESRTDLFLDVSTSRVQSLVEYIYSATEVLDQHWSMVQWNILGRGPYESLSIERREDVIRSIHQRVRIIESRYKLYEFMASIKLQNEMLYADLLKEFPTTTGVPLLTREIEENAQLLQDLDAHDQDAFPCWFYRKIELETASDEASGAAPSSLNGDAGSKTTATGDASSKAKWIEFPPHENRRLERYFRYYRTQKSLHGGPLPPPIVVVDEGRHEVNVDTMEMTPVYWTPVEKMEVRRSMWLYAQRNYGLAPYHPPAAHVLEQAFTYYLAYYEEEKQRIHEASGAKAQRRRNPKATPISLSIPVEGHLVEFKGPNDMMQYKRLLAGTTPFTSKRRVYRGDPRIRADPKIMELWKRAMASSPHGLRPNEDDMDIEEDVDHLVLIVHGIGDALKTIDIINVVTLRSIIDCAASLRGLHKEALRSSHFEKLGQENAKYPRTEFLPIEWHSKLHIEGLDRAIQDVTLPAIPKLREFANDTILDVLFFMSPIFHRVILDHVATEMNRVFTLFQSRNRGWGTEGSRGRKKKVSIFAHSLGSIISFDVLNHQPPRERPVKVAFHGDPIVESSEEDGDVDDEGNNDKESHTDEVEEEEEDERGSGGDHDQCNSRDDGTGFEAMMTEQLRERSRSDSECIHARYLNGRRAREPLSVGKRDKSNGGVVLHPKKHATRPPSATISGRLRSRSRAANATNGGPAQPTKRRRRSSRRSRPQRHRGTPSSASSSAAHDVPVLLFPVENLFCFGSPVGLFLNVRGQKISREFKLPTCKRVFNIYHPYDPVAYRIEPLLNPNRAHSKAAIIRTFEGKLRFQYQIRNSFRRMWQKLRQWRRNFETQVEKAVRSVGLVETATPALGFDSSATPNALSLMASTVLSSANAPSETAPGRFVSATEREDGEYGGGRYDVFGRLCQGLPIDYSLQENEIEITNEYLFALTSHVIYWGNRDASLFVAQKMILEPPLSSDSEDEDDGFSHGITVVPSGSISPAFSAFSSRGNSMAPGEDDSDDGKTA